MQVKTKRRLFIALILTSSIAGMLVLKNMRPEPHKKPVEDSSTLIEVLNLIPSNVTFEINSQGTVKPRTQTVLSAEISGQIIHISEKFIAGGIFKKNEILMKIDPTDYQVAVDQTEAFYQQRQIEFNGAKSLRSQGYRAESELASAKAALSAAKASLVIAKKNLDKTNIRLPYDGMVISKDSDLGQYVSPGNRLGTTFAIDKAEIRLPLTDQDLAFINLPDAADIAETGSFDGPLVSLSAIQKGKYHEWNAHIIRTEGIVDEKSRVTYAVAQIDDPYNLLKAGSDSENRSPLPIGSFVRATIQGHNFAAIFKIPRTAIRGKNELMFIDADNKLQIREVDIVRADNQFAYLLEGIKEGDRISITAIESPVNGMNVRTQSDSAKQENITKSNSETVADTK